MRTIDSELRAGVHTVGRQRYADTVGAARVQQCGCDWSDVGEGGGCVVIQRRGVGEQVVVGGVGLVGHIECKHEAVRRAGLSGRVQQ